MHPLIAAALLVVAGLGAARLATASRLRVAPRDAMLTVAAPLLLLGVILGPLAQLLDAATLRALTPLAALGSGWLGALLGSRYDWRRMRRIPAGAWAAGATLGLIVAGATALVAWALVRFVPALATAWRPTVPAILALGAIGATSAVPSHPAARRLALTTTALSVAAFGLLLALYRPGRAAPAAGSAALAVGASVIVAALLAHLLLWLGRLRAGEPRGSGIELVAVLLVAAGFGAAARLSPFIICALVTAVLTSRSGDPRSGGRRIRAVLEGWAPLVAGVFWIVCGARLRLPTAWLLLAPAALGVGRALALGLPLHLGRRDWVMLRVFRRGAGWRALAPGAAAIALALDFELAYRPPRGSTGTVLATVVLGTLLAHAAATGGRALWRARRPAPPAPLTAAPSHAEVT